MARCAHTTTPRGRPGRPRARAPPHGRRARAHPVLDRPRTKAREMREAPGRLGASLWYSAAPWRLGWRCDPTLGGADLDGYPEGEEGRRPSFTAMDFFVSPR